MIDCLLLFFHFVTSYVTFIRDVSGDLETKQKRVFGCRIPRDQAKELPLSLI
jgi:hypothetical protein